ncbi:cupin domain-containing protein [Emcibacter sp.]|uniref:cupin domain-containing protein n=1 Tax=Emcibacter sp. TaxID=1979954 RepID=UPI002AA92ADE|nr:cupin domain-containing protein [Emcibacter sp.]
MTAKLEILSSFPTAEKFYSDFWNRRPFVVKGALEAGLVESLITAEELAGLSLEEDVRSRLVTGPDGGWLCTHGPFEEEAFNELGERGWNLLVHNVERYHPPVADLLPLFDFSPRWLLDDIMVSYSVPGGSVGPHIDSYHVFLVQGQGRRRWKVGADPLRNEEYIPDIDLRVLKDGFEGTTVDVEAGDVIYIPPQVPHEGVTAESALTFSIGFLGPSLPELFMAYGQYLEAEERSSERFLGACLTEADSGFSISKNAVGQIRDLMRRGLETGDFGEWLVTYFSEPSVDEDFSDSVCPDVLAYFGQDRSLVRPQQDKLVILQVSDNRRVVGYGGRSFRIAEKNAPLLHRLESGRKIAEKDLDSLDRTDEMLLLLENILAAADGN